MARSMINGPTGPTVSSARWMGDFGSRDYLVPGGAKLDSTQVPGYDAVTIVVGAAGAIATATSVPVAALSGPIPNGTTISLGTNKFVRLTAAAAAGAVALTVAAIPTALVSGDTGTYLGIDKKYLPSGTLIGRTYTERDAGTGFGPAADTDDEFFLVAQDVQDAAALDDVELYRPGGTVYENFLPVFTALSATQKAAIRSRYQCTLGQA